MSNIIVRLVSYIGIVLASVACQRLGESAPPPTDFNVESLEGGVTLTWTNDPAITFWIYYAPGSDMNAENWSKITGSNSVMNVTSPYKIPGLTNDTLYTFAINARKEGGKGGPWATVQATPRLAGGKWEAGADITGTPTNPSLRAITYGTTFVAVGEGIYSNADGGKTKPATWTEGSYIDNSTGTATTRNVSYALTQNGGLKLNGVAYGGIYVAVGDNGTRWTSSNGVNWTDELTSDFGDVDTNTLNAIATNGTAYVAVGVGGTIMTRAVNGSAKWTKYKWAPSAPPPTLNAVVYANNKFVAIGDSGTVVTSTDGTSWIQASCCGNNSMSKIAFGNSLFIIVDANGDRYTSSVDNDGVWTKDSLPNAGFGSPINAFTYGTQFVAIDNASNVWTNITGKATDWMETTVNVTYNNGTPLSATIGTVKAVARGNNGYTAVGDAGMNATSYWTADNSYLP